MRVSGLWAQMFDAFREIRRFVYRGVMGEKRRWPNNTWFSGLWGVEVFWLWDVSDDVGRTRTRGNEGRSYEYVWFCVNFICV